MASLNSIAEQAYMQVYPMPDTETSLPKELFFEDAMLEYSYQLQLMYWKEKRDEGFFELPSHLLRETKVEVKNGEIDLCGLNVLRSFSSDVWLQKIGSFDCNCQYVRYNVNLASLLCDSDDKGHEYKVYIPLGNKIKFPDGVHENPLTIIYASKGDDLDGDIEVDEVIGNIVRDRLVEKYLGKSNPVDVTNNSNSNN